MTLTPAQYALLMVATGRAELRRISRGPQTIIDVYYRAMPPPMLPWWSKEWADKDSGASAEGTPA